MEEIATKLRSALDKQILKWLLAIDLLSELISLAQKLFPTLGGEYTFKPQGLVYTREISPKLSVGLELICQRSFKSNWNCCLGFTVLESSKNSLDFLVLHLSKDLNWLSSKNSRAHIKK